MSLTFSNTYAQNPGLDIRMPKIDKVITVTADGVNMRKSPSATAPALKTAKEQVELDGDYGWKNTYNWNGKGTNAHPTKGDIFMIVDETPEWYGIVWDYNLVAYISKNFATEANLTPITPESLNEVHQFGAITNGAYKGYCMAANLNNPDLEGELCGIGRIINGMAVFNTIINIEIVEAENKQQRLELVQFGEMPPALNYGSALLRKGFDTASDWYEWLSIDVTKLTTSEFQQIIKRFKEWHEWENHKPTDIYVKYNGSIRRLISYSPDCPAFKNCVIESYPANK